MTGDAKFIGKVAQNLTTRLTGWFIVSGGAITAQAVTPTSTSGGQQCGITWAWNAAGDYRATLHRGYKRMIRGDASLVMPGALGTFMSTALVAVVDVLTSAYFTGATPVPAAAGIGMTVQAVAGAKLDPTNGTVVTYDLEFTDI